MTVPPSSHPNWRQLVTGRKKFDFDFLAIKMAMGRVKLMVEQDPSEATIQKCINEVREIFEKNQNLSKVRNDLEKIFGSGV